MTGSAPVLRIEDLTVTYQTPHGEITALDRVGFEIHQGEAVALVGESGSGKSTLALAVLDLLPEEADVPGGAIHFLGEDLRRMAPAARARIRGDRISTVFQDPFTSLNPALTVGLQVAEPLIYHRGVPRDEALDRAVSLLGDVGIPRPGDVARSYPHQLSGGMQQRALIATALACQPPLLILDEPTTALDVTIQAQILDLLQELRAAERLSILFITHNLSVVNQLSDKVCVLYAGQVFEYGATRDVLGRPSHPYTKGLIGSLPAPAADPHGERLFAIPGKFPDLADLPAGCIFHPRCVFAEDRCREDAQRLEATAHGCVARCWKAGGLLQRRWADAFGDAGGAAPDRAPVSGPLVRIEGLRKLYDLGGLLSGLRLRWEGGRPRLRLQPMRVNAVDGVSLIVRKGEILGLVGESGCGKSTLGRCLVRLVEATTGRIVFDEVDVTRLKEARLRPFRKRAQMVFQNPDSSLNPRSRIGEAVARPLAVFDRLAAPERRARVGHLLEMVGLPPSYASRYPHQLSGGEKQRVGIARALASSPDFLVCDEAVSALDVSVQATVLNLLLDLRDRLSLAYLFISHDLLVVAQVSDRIAVMYAGVICEEGTTAQVLRPPYHPYTEALLSAIPTADPETTQRARIRLRGDVGSDRVPTRGCRFHRRCPRKLGEVCERETPPVIEPAPGHRIACHIPLEVLREAEPVLSLD